MMELTVKGAALLVTTVGGIGVAGWGGGIKAIDFLDNRYAPLQAVEDLAYSGLKKDIRELKDRIDAAEGEEKNNLQMDLAELIDRLCRSYPEDRECKAG